MENFEKRFGIYTSNQATRLKKFLLSPYGGQTNLTFVIHDGENAGALERLCQDNKIEFFHIAYESNGLSGKHRNAYLSELLHKKLNYFQTDYCFSFGTKIFMGALLNEYKNRIINFHPSLLPSFPGLHAIDQAFYHGALLLGNTAHFIDEGMDTGPMIMQAFLPRACFDGYDSVLDMQVLMMAQICRWLEQERIEVVGQEVTIRDAKYGPSFFIPNLEINDK